jgi:hypothetical protein
MCRREHQSAKKMPDRFMSNFSDLFSTARLFQRDCQIHGQAASALLGVGDGQLIAPPLAHSLPTLPQSNPR